MKFNGIRYVCIALSLFVGACNTTSIRMKQNTSVKVTPKVESRYTGPKRRVGVIDFNVTAEYAKDSIAAAATDIIMTELTKTGKFVVVERDRMNTILKNQEFEHSGAVDPETAVKVGKILGVNAILTGSVSQFGSKKGGTDFLVTQSKYQIVEATVDIRIVDAETGRVLFADSGKGVVKKQTSDVLGLGGRAKYDQTLEGEAIRAAIVKLMDNIVSQVNMKPWSCRVAAVEDGAVYINAGNESGLRLGQQLTLFSQGKEIKDPTTGVVMGRTESMIGMVEIGSFFGDDGSKARLVSGTMPQPNDLCRMP